MSNSGSMKQKAVKRKKKKFVNKVEIIKIPGDLHETMKIYG